MESGEKTLVLIVDDKPKNLQVLGSMLKKSGFNIAAAQNGRQALDFVEKKPPGAILLDVMMPEMDGFQTADRSPQHNDLDDVPHPIETIGKANEAMQEKRSDESLQHGSQGDAIRLDHRH
ncbi:MAG: response regulator [Proteobacteria bacterium]|nr:response regulator [Pseudomonadota bacterium]